MKNYDAIIIGAGLGGLTAGAKLAREGKKVLLLEQHSKPGGCATTFRRGDFTLEVGLHEMDGPSARDMKTRIFNELEVFGNVQFIKVPEFYHFVNDRLSITIPHSPDEAIGILSDKFPDEIEGIRAFYNHILTPRKKTTENEINTDISLGIYLDSVIKNEDLKLVLLGNLGYFHDDPYTLSLNYYSLAQGSYLTGGASYIKGGSQKLSDHLMNYIIDHEGEVLLNNLVTRLIVKNDKLVGVSYKKKNDRSSYGTDVYGDEIVANTALPNIAELLPDDYGKRLNTELNVRKPGASLLTIYFGFRSNLKSIGNKYYSTFCFDSSIRTQADIVQNNMGDINNRSFTFVDYGQIDSDLAPVGKSVGAICCIDYLADWDNLPAEDYRSKKEAVVNNFILRLEKLLPGITSEIEYYEVGTSSTIKRYTLNPAGAVYGFAQTPGSNAPDVSKFFDNLHPASAWGKTGGGFSGAIYGGYLCALNILRKNSGKKKL
jgi:all-trans-retinol 13,14-reductase